MSKRFVARHATGGRLQGFFMILSLLEMLPRTIGGIHKATSVWHTRLLLHVALYGGR
jgi:hypothetical protein